jgi:hypothetical protein
MSSGSDPVTRDALRADLATMKGEILEAISTAVAPVNSQLLVFARGEFTQAQTRSVQVIAEGVIENRGDNVWTRRSRRITVISLVLGAFGLISSAAMLVLMATSGA